MDTSGCAWSPAPSLFRSWDTSRQTLLHMQNKNALSLFKRQSACKHSAVPLSVAVPLRKTAAHSPRSRADAVTGITRPHLLASSFSRRLQGDIRPPRPSALHQTAALFAGTKGLLVLIHAKMFSYRIIISRSGGLSTRFDDFFRGKDARSLIAVALGGISVDAGLEQLVAAEFQQPPALDLVKGHHPPLRVHPDAPDRLLFLFRHRRSPPARKISAFPILCDYRIKCNMQFSHILEWSGM